MNAVMRPHYSVEHPPRWPVVLAVVVHLLLIGWVIYAGKYLAPPPPEPLPDIVELWEGGKAPRPAPAPVQRAQPQTRETPQNLDMPDVTDAEIQLNAARERAERERQQRPTPRVEPERPTPTPPPAQPETRPQTKPTPTKPAKPSPHTQVDPSTDLDLPGAGSGGQGRQGSGNAARTQQGGKTGAENGERGGKGVNLDAYKREAAARVRSFASAPPGTEGSPRVTVNVRLGPSMQVLGVTVTKSSGDSAYDQAVVQGVRNVGTFPPRPDGASMDLFRNITLNISLPNR